MGSFLDAKIILKEGWLDEQALIFIT